MSVFETINISNGQQADAAAATGNPLRVAGEYVSTAPTLTTGQANSLQLDANANLKTVVENGVQSGTAGTPSANVLTVQGASGMTSIQTQLSQAIAGGSSYSSAIAPATPAIATPKSTAGSVVAIRAVNILSTIVYLKLFDVSGAITLGTTAATYQFPILPNTPLIIQFNELRSHTYSIKYAVTGAIAYADDTSITANSVLVDISYN